MKDCAYPKCEECKENDCIMEANDIHAMLKRRRYAADPDKYRGKQIAYRNRIKSNLPHCDECDSCVVVINQKGNGTRKLCIEKMRLIEQKVSNCPQWCVMRKATSN